MIKEKIKKIKEDYFKENNHEPSDVELLNYIDSLIDEYHKIRMSCVLGDEGIIDMSKNIILLEEAKDEILKEVSKNFHDGETVN